MSVDNAWWVALAAAHTADLKRQSEFWRDNERDDARGDE